MGAAWTSWRTTTTVIFVLLQIKAMISSKTVTGVEGEVFYFTCDYPVSQQSQDQYFCHVVNNSPSDPIIRTNKRNEWVTRGRFALNVSTTGASFTVRVDPLLPEDSGTYWCGVGGLDPDHITVVHLNVSQAPASSLPSFPVDLMHVDKLHLPLYLTAAMCVTAMLCVCLFTLCLLLAVRQRRSGPRRSREFSSDYETMMPGVRTEPELCCGCPDPECCDLSSSPLPPPDLCSHCTPKQRDSILTLGLSEYVDVDVPGHICQYQHLDLDRSEEHVYHSLSESGGTKGEPPGGKKAD